MSDTDNQLLGEGDYTMTDDSLWVTVEDLAVYILRTEDGVSVQVYADGREMEPELGDVFVRFEQAKRIMEVSDD